MDDESKEECKHCGRTIFLPYTFTDNPGATHWEGCWRAHHACAVAMIERLIAGAA